MKNKPYLKEERYHGTMEFPCAYYDMRDDGDRLEVKHHWHEELEMLYFRGGSFTIQVGMESFRSDRESFWFVNSGELHSLLVEAPCEECAVVFHLRVLDFDRYDLVQSRLLGPLAGGSLVLPRTVGADHPLFPRLKQEYLEIREQFRQQDGEKEAGPGFQILVKAGLLKILGFLWEAGLLRESEPGSSVRMEALKGSLTYIREHYGDKIYLRELADQAGMNEQYFSRFFKGIIGKSPVAFLNEYRVRCSMALLRDTDRSVTEICLECGFHNLGNYLREFRRFTGTTPLQYRKASRAKKSK